MTTHKEALTLALEALENLINQHYAETTTNDDLEKADNAITAIKEALANHIPDATKMVAQPEHEPDEVDIRSRLYQRIHELETQLALPEQELTNLERHERNVQQLFGTQQPKEQEPACCTGNCPNKKECSDAMQCLYTTPPFRKPLTDEMVLAGARALAKRHADSCGLDFDDVWKYYAEEHKIDAKAVIEAAHGIKGDA